MDIMTEKIKARQQPQHEDKPKQSRIRETSEQANSNNKYRQGKKTDDLIIGKACLTFPRLLTRCSMVVHDGEVDAGCAGSIDIKSMVVGNDAAWFCPMLAYSMDRCDLQSIVLLLIPGIVVAVGLF